MFRRLACVHTRLCGQRRASGPVPPSSMGPRPLVTTAAALPVASTTPSKIVKLYSLYLVYLVLMYPAVCTHTSRHEPPNTMMSPSHVEDGLTSLDLDMAQQLRSYKKKIKTLRRAGGVELSSEGLTSPKAERRKRSQRMRNHRAMFPWRLAATLIEIHNMCAGNLAWTMVENPHLTIAINSLGNSSNPLSVATFPAAVPLSPLKQFCQSAHVMHTDIEVSEGLVDWRIEQIHPPPICLPPASTVRI